MVFAVFLIALGIVFFARELNFLSEVSANVIWAVTLIVVGWSLLSHKRWGHYCSEKDCWRCAEVSFGTKGTPRKRK